MCARYSLTASPDEVAVTFGLPALDDFPPRYNIAPTQPILMVANGPGGRRQGVLVRWGLVPAWVKDPAAFSLLVNARAETAAEKPAFQNAMRHRRTLVPASGFYEWHRPAGSGKAGRAGPSQPYWIRPREGGIVAFAALMETWSAKDGSEIDTGAILTTDANATLAPVHPRMPVVIRPEDFGRWLDCMNYRPQDVADLLVPADPDLFEAVPVSHKVNRVANAGPDLQEPTREGEMPAAPAKPARGKTLSTGPADPQLKLF